MACPGRRKLITRVSLKTCGMMVSPIVYIKKKKLQNFVNTTELWLFPDMPCIIKVYKKNDVLLVGSHKQRALFVQAIDRW